MTSVTPVLKFDEDLHRYSLAGHTVPSVTQILESVGIIDYSSIPDGVRMVAMERGRFVHTLCEYHDEGTLDPQSVDCSLAGYLDAWRNFRLDTGFTPDLIEHRGYNETWNFAGTLDRTGIMAGMLTLLDIKTTQAPYWTRYQTAAYSAFFPKPAQYRRMAVALHADGTYRVNEYSIREYSRDINVFLAALSVAQAKPRKDWGR